VLQKQREKEPAAPAKAQKPTFEKTEVVTVTATVEAIDQATRMVTLKGPKGNTVTFKAGEEVRNLPQVKVGDQVVAKYYESLADRGKKAGEATPGVTKRKYREGQAGEKPAGSWQPGDHTATVKAMDMKKPL